MAKGRPRKPSKIKELEGNRAKVGRKRITTDMSAPGKPHCPAHLNADEKSIWKSVVASLPVGLLTAADNWLLERMAVATAQFRLATKAIKREGMTKRTKEGLVRNPLLIVQNIARVEMDRCGQQLGLSPVARTRLVEQQTGDPDSDPMGALLDELENDPAATRQ